MAQAARKNKRTISGTQLKAVKNNNKKIVNAATKKKSVKRNRKKKTGIVEQVVTAFHKENRVATIAGFFLGGFVPLATYFVAHNEINLSNSFVYQIPAFIIVLGGLAYSAKTVYEWGKMAFASSWKACGFVALIEGIMVTVNIQWLAVLSLGYLMLINGIATGCRLSVVRPDEQG